jgi:cell division protein FtsQ
VLATAAVVLVAAAWVLLGTSLAGARRVAVVGTDRLTAARVLAAARVPAGHPLATLDTAAIQARVAALPAVATVRVVREWPSTVRIVVTERRPVAVVSAGGGHYRLVDPTGVAFWPVTGRHGLPLLAVARSGPRNRATVAALDVLAALPPSVRHRVVRIGAPTPADVTLRLRGGKTVVWGTPADGARKAAVLAAVLRRPGHVYDVSVPDVTTVR